VFSVKDNTHCCDGFFLCKLTYGWGLIFKNDIHAVANRQFFAKTPSICPFVDG